MTLAKVVSRDRLPSLTGLRFWAALLVVLYHLSRSVGPLPVISDVAWYGRSGVTFFFVLSGFVLTWTYFDQRPKLSTFWWRRFARIWPALAVSAAPRVRSRVRRHPDVQRSAPARHADRDPGVASRLAWRGQRRLVAQQRGVLLPVVSRPACRRAHPMGTALALDRLPRRSAVALGSATPRSPGTAGFSTTYRPSAWSSSSSGSCARQP